MTKRVQTILEEEEYKEFREILEKKRLSIREGLKLAVSNLIKSEFTIDPDDPFFTHKPVGRSGLGDLSRKHDKYLYEEERE
ncbi:MAG: hypothetical protein ACE5L6_02475 [Candidatus Bathyarchaeia archaeon]